MKDPENKPVETTRRRRCAPTVTPGYLSGDAAASAYLGWRDPQARTFRAWSKEMRIPYALISGRANYKISDLDAAWEKAAESTKFIQASA